MELAELAAIFYNSESLEGFLHLRRFRAHLPVSYLNFSTKSATTVFPDEFFLTNYVYLQIRNGSNPLNINKNLP